MSVAYDHVGPWTVTDVLGLPEDIHQRVELVGGALMMSPSPTVPHQRASRRLSAILEAAADAAGAPVEALEAVNVVFADGLLIPDITLVDANAAATAGLTVSAADVLAVVEIASASTRLVDRKVKPALYAGAGIPCFWRVELEPTPRILPATLRDGAYDDLPEALAGTVARLGAPFPVAFDPATLARTR